MGSSWRTRAIQTLRLLPSDLWPNWGGQFGVFTVVGAYQWTDGAHLRSHWLRDGRRNTLQSPPLPNLPTHPQQVGGTAYSAARVPPEAPEAAGRTTTREGRDPAGILATPNRSCGPLLLLLPQGRRPLFRTHHAQRATHGLITETDNQSRRMPMRTPLQGPVGPTGTMHSVAWVREEAKRAEAKGSGRRQGQSHSVRRLGGGHQWLCLFVQKTPSPEADVPGARK